LRVFQQSAKKVETMISYSDARKIIAAAGAERPLQAETVALGGIAGRVCAADVSAPVANQPFDNSAMDGFALNVEDLALAANDNPVTLEMAGHIAAGDPARFAPPPRGQCYEIMTGAPLPPGCDAVVPVEKTEKEAGGKIRFRAMPGKGDNIRRAGEDFAAGDVAIEKGRLLDAGHALALATLGIGAIPVLRRPRVALVSTGREIVDDLGAKLGPGQIYNSTGPYLKLALAALGAEVECHGSVPDDAQAFRDRLSRMAESGADICLSTGAVSAGVHDFVPSALKDMGAELLFHKTAIKPGKPILFARFPGGPLFVGLPGNPASSAAGTRFFIHPLLRAMRGLPPEAPRHAVVKGDYKGAESNLRLFLRGALSVSEKAVREIEIPARQQSFRVRPFAETNAWAVIPEGKAVKAGDLIEVYR
jgi:molybdopterin molybdotransferase